MYKICLAGHFCPKDNFTCQRSWKSCIFLEAPTLLKNWGPPFFFKLQVICSRSHFIVQNVIFVLWNTQFYIQWLYRPHFGKWTLPFGLLGSTVGSKWKIYETTEFLLKYATFWGSFFMFSWDFFLHFSVGTKELL